jgi:DNA-binding transcriptional MerR regulator
MLGDLLSEVGGPRSTLDRYVRLGLIPYSTDGNDYRLFCLEDACRRVELVRLLRKRPFKYNLDEVKHIFGAITIQVLVEERNKSNKALRFYLVNQGF